MVILFWGFIITEFFVIQQTRILFIKFLQMKVQLYSLFWKTNFKNVLESEHKKKCK